MTETDSETDIKTEVEIDRVMETERLAVIYTEVRMINTAVIGNDSEKKRKNVTRRTFDTQRNKSSVKNCQVIVGNS